MKTIIYYFTGTGNSLAVAKKIAAALGNCNLVPIASLQNTKGDIVPQAERVGLVSPVYFTGIPVMVTEFARRLDLSRSQYTFSIVTFAVPEGHLSSGSSTQFLRSGMNAGLIQDSW